MRMLHIKECYFKLPEDFNGSIGDILLLMANRYLQSEAYKEINERNEVDFDNEFIASNKKGIIAYEFVDIEE